MEKVVKCRNKKCGLYFGHSEKNTKCPFCKTEYDEVKEKPASSAEASAAKKEKEGPTKTQKNSFKIWKDKN